MSAHGYARHPRPLATPARRCFLANAHPWSARHIVGQCEDALATRKPISGWKAGLGTPPLIPSDDLRWRRPQYHRSDLQICERKHARGDREVAGGRPQPPSAAISDPAPRRAPAHPTPVRRARAPRASAGHPNAERPRQRNRTGETARPCPVIFEPAPAYPCCAAAAAAD